MKTKRILSVFLVAIMMIATISTIPICVSAEGFFDDALTMKQLEYYSPEAKANVETKYKITIPSNGTISFRYTNRTESAKFKLFNSNAEEIATNDAGYYFNSGDIWAIKDLKKGTYYLSIHNNNRDYSFNDLYYTFTPDKKAALSLKISMKKGATIQFGSVLENYKGSVSWLSTAKSVASVSKTGTVKALKKGTTTIRAALTNGTYAQIRISVN